MPPVTQKTISGHHAFYVIPDDTTISNAKTYAANLGNNPHYTSRAPFISVYQAYFKDAPLHEIDRLLDAMTQGLLYAPLSLDKTIDVTVDGMKYLRWMVKYNQKALASEPLYHAHILALGLARWLDPTWHQSLVSFMPKMKPPQSKEEKTNIIDFGQAHSRNLFAPYILLASSGSAHNFRNPRQNLPRYGMIQSFGFAEMVHRIELGNIVSERK